MAGEKAGAPGALGGKVLMGTCGWSDESLLKCGKLYPSHVKSAEDRLHIYSRHFACVEVRGGRGPAPTGGSWRGW